MHNTEIHSFAMFFTKAKPCHAIPCSCGIFSAFFFVRSFKRTLALYRLEKCFLNNASALFCKLRFNYSFLLFFFLDFFFSFFLVWFVQLNCFVNSFAWKWALSGSLLMVRLSHLQLSMVINTFEHWIMVQVHLTSLILKMFRFSLHKVLCVQLCIDVDDFFLLYSKQL